MSNLSQRAEECEVTDDQWLYKLEFLSVFTTMKQFLDFRPIYDGYVIWRIKEHCLSVECTHCLTCPKCHN